MTPLFHPLTQQTSITIITQQSHNKHTYNHKLKNNPTCIDTDQASLLSSRRLVAHWLGRATRSGETKWFQHDVRAQCCALPRTLNLRSSTHHGILQASCIYLGVPGKQVGQVLIELKRQRITDVLSTNAINALLCARSVIKVTTRWVMTNQTNGTYQHSAATTIANEILMTEGLVGVWEKIHSKQLEVGA